MQTTSNYTKEEQKAISQKIFSQLGGNRFAVMTGAKNLLYGISEDGNPFLRMNIGANSKGVKMLQIELTPFDTYTMTFYKASRVLDQQASLWWGKNKYRTEMKICKVSENVYCDQLRSTFTANTGLYTSLAG